MPTVVTLLYPAVDFNMDYYLTKHMPLVAKTWKDEGLLSWSVVKTDPSSGHGVQCLLVWDKEDSFKKAFGGPAAAEIMGDIKNYTAGTPISFAGEEVGSG